MAGKLQASASFEVAWYKRSDNINENIISFIPRLQRQRAFHKCKRTEMSELPEHPAMES